MTITDAKIGLEVVRSKGDYVVGQISEIDAIDYEKNRVHTTQGYWVKVECFEPTSIPYEITEMKICKRTGRYQHSKYIRK